jgi:hypothetical protein
MKVNRILIALVALFLSLGSGCAPHSTPDGADVVAGVFEQAGFEFLHWEERGLAIMIWHDFLGDSGSSSTLGGTLPADAGYKIRGYAEDRDGQRFDWEMHVQDGQTVQFWIDGTAYPLSDGALFIVTHTGGTTDVIQRKRDLSHVQPDARSCVAFAQSDPDLARLISGLAKDGATSRLEVGTEDEEAVRFIPVGAY